MNFRALAAGLFFLCSTALGAEKEALILNAGNSGVTVSVQEPGRTILSIDLAELKYEQNAVNGEIEYSVSLPDDFEMSRGAYLGPQDVLLPTITRIIAVPFDSEPTVKILGSSYKEFERFNLAPADDEALASYRSSDNDFSMNFQANLVVGENAGIMRDLRLYSVTISPVRYDPENSTLLVYDNIEIEITHSGSKMTRYDGKISEAFSPIYKSILDNPLVFDPIEITRGAYWIIYPDAYLEYLDPLIEWNKTRGFSVRLIAKGDIGSNPTYVNIKNYIVALFDTCDVKPDYIAIVGDVTMPNNYGIPTRNYSNPHGSGDIESDNYYTFIEGNDYFPEVLIGRISVYSVTHLNQYIAKLFAYERTPYMGDTEWYHRASVSSGGDDGYFVSPRITKMLCREFMMNNGYTFVDTMFDSSGNIPASRVISSINSGVSFVNYRGYGDATGWTYPRFVSSSISQLSNGPRYPIMTSIVCGTGDFNDGWTPECFGETWIRSANKGGAGFMGNTNHYAHTVWTNSIDAGIYWGWFYEGSTTLAQGLLMGKMNLYYSFPSDRGVNGQVELYFNSYNILGDPELNCWKDIPMQMIADHPDSVEMGQNHFDVTVTDGLGSPLERAYVNIWKGEEIYDGGFTAANGEIHFDATALTEGSMRVTAVAPGYIPYEGSAEYYSNSVTIGYLSHIIDDDASGESSGNGNSVLNPSETIELSLELKNYGLTETAHNVTAVLSSNNEYIEVMRDSAGFGDIAPEGVGTSNQPYLVNVHPDAANMARSGLILVITDNEGHSWNAIIHENVEAAEFSVDSVTVIDAGDGRIDPGEICELRISLSNIGDLGIESGAGILRTSDDQVTIMDSLAAFGNCPPGESFDNQNNTFILRADDFIYVGHVINFTLELTGIGPQVVTTAFSLPVGEISSHDPIGPDDYGYYCFDNTDTSYTYHPEFDWIPIDTQNWQYVQIGDDEVRLITLPFTVSYYGEEFERLTICDNGFVALGGTDWNAWYNTPIPAPQNAPGMVAAFWDDFKQSGLRIYYYHDVDNGRFIVGWNNAYDEDVFRYQTFEIIFLDLTAWPTLTGDNEILFQYNSVSSPYSMSAGICSPDRRDGIGYIFNNNYAAGAANITNGRALKFTTGSMYFTGTEDESKLARGFSLAQSYPNPFNASAAIEFSIPSAGNVQLEIFNVLGQKITTLVDNELQAGSHKVIWNAGDIPSGVYFYRLSWPQGAETKRMTLLK